MRTENDVFDYMIDAFESIHGHTHEEELAKLISDQLIDDLLDTP